MNKILLYNYSLSVYFSRGKKELVKKGTWFLFANELFFVSVSFAMFLITRFDIKIPGAIILISYLLIWYGAFYGIRNWVQTQLETKKIEGQYKALERKTSKIFLGFLFFIGSFLLFLIVAISTFQGYLKS
ncbi:MAG: hypothetical protein MH472_11580 [Bacteroidia bacterium]|nr:hypothetical protein [Bacteroidia bacterium]